MEILQLITNLRTIDCEHLQSGGINIYDDKGASIFMRQKDIPLFIEWLNKVDEENFKKSLNY